MYALKMVACIIWGMAWCFLGVLLVLSIIGLPLAPVAFAIGSAPLAKVQHRHVTKRAEAEIEYVRRKYGRL